MTFSRPPRRAGLPAAAALLAIVACGRGGTTGSLPASLGPHRGANHPNVGGRAADFAVQDPSGPWLPLASLNGKPVALLFFRTGAPFAPEMVREFGRLRDDRSYSPIVFLGLDNDTLDRVKQFRTLQKATLPLLRDPGSVARAYGVGELPTVVLLDTDHIVRFQLDGYLGSDFRASLEATITALKTLNAGPPQAAKAVELNYTEHPRAPLFAGRDLDGRAVDLATLKGRVTVLIFFDQDCPHCQKDLPRLLPVLREFRARGVAAIGVTSRDAGGGLRPYLKGLGIDFPVIVDASRSVFDKYASSRTPDIFLIDKDGFVRFREEGDRPDRASLTHLQLRLLLGDAAPAALAASLPKGRFSGDGTCRACHEREYDDWLLTPHSIAWDSLQSGEKWRDPSCVGCHVTGRGHPGGFADAESSAHLVNVQCEVCHGPGGGHPEGARVDLAAMGRICASCHKGKFVLNFDLNEALALMAHRDHPDLAKRFKYSDEQRQRLDEINKRRLEKFRSGVAYVGVDACRDCHRAEYEQWSASPHAAAFATLLRAGRSYDKTCTPCHTTGTGSKGGFGQEPVTARPMLNVQCEVCHGPGEDHLKAPPSRKKGTIYGITDQCSFCIIQGVCATCHDQANDPRFAIEKALPRVRHHPAGPGGPGPGAPAAPARPAPPPPV